MGNVVSIKLAIISFSEFYWYQFQTGSIWKPRWMINNSSFKEDLNTWPPDWEAGISVGTDEVTDLTYLQQTNVSLTSPSSEAANAKNLFHSNFKRKLPTLMMSSNCSFGRARSSHLSCTCSAVTMIFGPNCWIKYTVLVHLGVLCCKYINHLVMECYTRLNKFMKTAKRCY